MEKFNHYWILKYSELRSQLQKCNFFDSKDVFLDTVIFEVSYPHSFKGYQLRYTLGNIDFSSFPEGSSFLLLTRQEKSRLYSYYQLDKYLSN